MSTNTTEAYVLHCLSQLHAGSGDEGYDYIDKRVQRDPTTQRPCIHASSLKGALREHFENLHWLPTEVPSTRVAQEGEKAPSPRVNTHEVAKKVFGSSVNEADEKTSQGQYRFLSAQLLSFPVRSNLQPYYMCTCPQIATDLLRQHRLVGFPMQPVLKGALEKLEKYTGPATLLPNGTNEPCFLEEIEALGKGMPTLKDEERTALEDLMGSPLALMPNTQFNTLMESLPVVARNQLDNGESKNLWYEELVPREARFWFLLMYQHKIKEFHDLLAAECIQIGANATVGYGLTHITPLAKP